MCELLGMSANVPTDIRFSFSGFALRGGAVRPNADGWGIDFYDGPAARTFLDTLQCARSDLARYLGECPIKSRVVVAHVRKANRGRIALANTHPFIRELWGRAWTFAHNGQLRGVKRLALGRHRPIGTTDSEHAFCWLLGRLQESWDRAPAAGVLDRALARHCRELNGLGVFNALISDSRTLYAHCGRRLCYLTRRAPFGTATLVDEDWRVDFAEETTADDVVTVVATRPLTRDEAWTDLPAGRLFALRAGEIAAVKG